MLCVFAAVEISVDGCTNTSWPRRIFVSLVNSFLFIIFRSDMKFMLSVAFACFFGMSCISQRVRYDLYKILCQPRDKVLYLEYSFCLFIRPGFLIWIGWQIYGICETDYLTGWISFLLSKQQLGMWRKLFLVTTLLLFFCLQCFDAVVWTAERATGL